MKLVTVSVDGETLDALAAMAWRRGITLAQITREGLATYVSCQQGRGKSLSLAGIGRSGRSDVGERDEELLKEGFRD